ncbi:hypothetical protein SAMN05421853_11939 [Roseivivax halotolerans]|uniref:Uncharacterized protein n=1 Tax=Roseivivax halotolerans TaxID=93684 RepID=A0A1I6AGN9_9RHOB|nr:hypothetical protein [Roseivivax halotolerans]SFQ67888.1 hypothetical protein SAMN05421853_11939 [Roseivivax halotolerans]
MRHQEQVKVFMDADMIGRHFNYCIMGYACLSQHRADLVEGAPKLILRIFRH